MQVRRHLFTSLPRLCGTVWGQESEGGLGVVCDAGSPGTEVLSEILKKSAAGWKPDETDRDQGQKAKLKSLGEKCLS